MTEPIRSRPLDELTLTVVVDNETDTLSSVDAGVPQLPEVASHLARRPATRQHAGHGCVTVFDHLCVACHGLSVLVTGARRRRHPHDAVRRRAVRRRLDRQRRPSRCRPRRDRHRVPVALALGPQRRPPRRDRGDHLCPASGGRRRARDRRRAPRPSRSARHPIAWWHLRHAARRADDRRARRRGWTRRATRRRPPARRRLLPRQRRHRLERRRTRPVSSGTTRSASVRARTATISSSPIR